MHLSGIILLPIQFDFCFQMSLLHSNVGADYFLVYGGLTSENKLNKDLWVYNIESDVWSVHSPETPPAHGVYQHASSVVPTSKKVANTEEGANQQKYLYVFGGKYESRGGQTQLSSDMYRFDWASKTWEKVNSTANGIRKVELARAAHSMVYDAVSHSLVVYGGFVMGFNKYGQRSAAEYDDTVLMFSLETSQWYKVASQKMESTERRRAFHSSLVVGDYMVVMGGISPDSCQSNAVLFYHLRCHTWRNATVEGRDFPSLHGSAAINSSVVLIQGGFANGGVSSDQLLAYKLPLFTRETDNRAELCMMYATDVECQLDGRCSWCNGICATHCSGADDNYRSQSACPQQKDDDLCRVFSTCSSCVTASSTLRYVFGCSLYICF